MFIRTLEFVVNLPGENAPRELDSLRNVPKYETTISLCNSSDSCISY